MPAVPLHSSGRAAVLVHRPASERPACVLESRARLRCGRGRRARFVARRGGPRARPRGRGAGRRASLRAARAVRGAPGRDGTHGGHRRAEHHLPHRRRAPRVAHPRQGGSRGAQLFDRSVRPKLEGVGDAGPKLSKVGETRRPPGRHELEPRRGPSRRRAPIPRRSTPTTSRAPSRARVVVVLGDSLAPAWARRRGGGLRTRASGRVGERLAERTGERVAWIAVGKRAADAATIRRDVVPALRRRLHTRRDRPSVDHVGDGPRTDDDEDDDGDGTRRDVRDGVRTDDARVDVDAVVLMCGVNDFKRAPWGRTPEAFRRELDALVDEVRDVVGDECLVALPGVPMECARRYFPRRYRTSPSPRATRGTIKNDASPRRRGTRGRRRIGPNRGSGPRSRARARDDGPPRHRLARARDVRGETDGGPDGSFRAGRDGEGWNTPERVGLRGVGAPHRGRGARERLTEADRAAETRGNGGERGEGEGKRRREVLAGDADG